MLNCLQCHSACLTISLDYEIARFYYSLTVVIYQSYPSIRTPIFCSIIHLFIFGLHICFSVDYRIISLSFSLFPFSSFILTAKRLNFPSVLISIYNIHMNFNGIVPYCKQSSFVYLFSALVRMCVFSTITFCFIFWKCFALFNDATPEHFYEDIKFG